MVISGFSGLIAEALEEGDSFFVSISFAYLGFNNRIFNFFK